MCGTIRKGLKKQSAGSTPSESPKRRQKSGFVQATSPNWKIKRVIFKKKKTGRAVKNLFPDEDNGSPSSINAPIDEHSDSDSGSSVKGNSEDKGSNGGSSMEVGGGTPKFDDEDEEDDYVLASLLEKDSKRKKERVLTFDDM